MPMYDFKCKQCGRVEEVFHRMSEDITPPDAPCCGQPMQRVYAAPHFTIEHGTMYLTLKDLDKYGDPGEYVDCEPPTRPPQRIEDLK